MIFAKLAWDLITLIYTCPTWLRQSAGWAPQQQQSAGDAATDRGPWVLIRAAARAVIGKMSPVTFQAFATLVVAFGLAVFTQWKINVPGAFAPCSIRDRKQSTLSKRFAH